MADGGEGALVAVPGVGYRAFGLVGRQVGKRGAVPVRGEGCSETVPVEDVSGQQGSELLGISHQVHVSDYEDRRIGFQMELAAGGSGVPDECHDGIDFELPFLILIAAGRVRNDQEEV